MDAQNVTLTAALAAGLLSFFSPCVLPLVPIYLGYMTGTAVSGLNQSQRLRTLTHALFFVLGFGLLFVLLGAAAGLLGRLLYPILPYMTRVGGVILILFGLNMTGLLTIPFLNMEKRLDLGSQPRNNYWASFLIGVIFAAGWTPCVGPVLTAILFLAADSQTATTGAGLLAVYALGLGLPFLGVAGLVDVTVPALRRMGRYLRVVSIAGGVLLIAMGFLMVIGLFEQIAFQFNAWAAGA
ncbi:MAG: cytochrome c biogenesis protein CcdA [Chloroflexi bacterium]|jgi:cytochrome c-type biogenesis protein|nr:cytochrome c biogenesis protein CcdA [Chloroflexota bacterium]